VGTVVTVTDEQEVDLRDYQDLTDVSLRRKLEPAGGLYIAESYKVISRAIDAGHIPRSILTSEKYRAGMVDLAAKLDVPIFVASDSIIESITGYEVHRGALAAMERPELPTIEAILEKARLVVILEDLVDHTNVGAIFRAVAGLGADAVIVTPECADPFYRRSIRVSMGTVFQVPWTRALSWPGSLDSLRSAGFHVAGLALSDDAVSLKDFAVRRPEKVALVLGAEGDGISSQTLGYVDSVVRIPMLHGVDSLNVASAAAVAIYALT
jgi:tRNA G18 (ribose-2'-O)-methylase SpoU